MSASISPEQILRELSEMWIATGRQGQAESGAGVLRACVMTLIVLSEETEDAADLGETIAALMPEHPARAILVRLTGAGERALAERVYAQCWMPFGGRRQICCEHIEIRASDASLPDLPSALLPLVAPDLPVILWSRCARRFDTPEFHALASVARKAAVDTAGMPDARAALPRLAAMAQRGMLVADLSWTQLTRWREMLSHVFENREYLARLPEIFSVRISHAGQSAPAAAWYLGAWLLDSLAQAGVKARLNLAPAAELTGRGLTVELGGGGFSVSLERQADRLQIRVGGAANCVSLPQPTDYMLMREELGLMGRDAVFERTLASAARLALSSSA